MFLHKKRYSIIFRAIAQLLVCLFLVNDLSWAAPSYTTPQQTTLAPELRLKPFFEKHGLDFKNIFSVYLVSAELRNLAMAKEVRDSQIVKLNRLFANEEIEIEKDTGKDKFIETYYLECTGRKCKYAILNFKKDNAKIKVLFPENPSTLEERELAELGIKTDEDKEHFSRGGLDGVWFVNRDTVKTSKAVDSKEVSFSQNFPTELFNRLDMLRSVRLINEAVNESATPNEIKTGGHDYLDHALKVSIDGLSIERMVMEILGNAKGGICRAKGRLSPGNVHWTVEEFALSDQIVLKVNITQSASTDDDWMHLEENALSVKNEGIEFLTDTHSKRQDSLHFTGKGDGLHDFAVVA